MPDNVRIWPPREISQIINQDEFAAAAEGRRFFTTHQTPGTLITAQTSFVATTPTFLFRNASATKGIILRNFLMTQLGTIAGGPISYTVAVDTADRYSSGGTLVVPQNSNTKSTASSILTAFYTNPTASAAGAGTRYVLNGGVGAALGTPTNIVDNDAYIIGTTGSILIYVWAATTAPSLAFVGDHVDN